MTSDTSSMTAKVVALQIIVLCSFLGFWELAAQANWLNPLLIGRPSAIGAFLWDEIFVSKGLWIDFYWSMAGMLASFVLGSVAGVLCGMLFVSKPLIEAVLNPFLTALNAMPRIALAPLFLIWFGLGLGSKIAVGFSLTFFIVLSSTVAGGRGVNPDHLVLAKTLGASQTQVFRKFVLPSAVPVVFNGLRLGLVFALLGVIGTEILASEHGLGQRLTVLAASFRTSGVFAIIILLALIGVTINGAMGLLERHLLRWR